MRVLHQDRFKGEIKVQIDAPDDLWHLFNIIQVDDILVMSTYRRDESAKVDKVRAERSFCCSLGTFNVRRISSASSTRFAAAVRLLGARSATRYYLLDETIQFLL